MISDQEIKAQYVNPSLPGSFSGFESFSRALRNRGVFVGKKRLKNWIQSQPTYTKHHPIRRRYQRNRVIVSGIDDTWQADLVDMQKWSRQNNGYKFLLTCIDVFSKFAWVVPLKSKTAKSVLDAFKKIFNSKNRRPRNLQTDKGTEFFNRQLKPFLTKYDVKSELKASIVERFNRTLKEKMWRRFTLIGQNKYIDIIAELVDSYNNTYHRSINMSPSDVNKENESYVWKYLYQRDLDSTIKYKFQVGDQVVVSIVKNLFEKGYDANWSEEVYEVEERVPRSPPVYRIKDERNRVLQGLFYEKELQKVKHTGLYRISQILRRRTRNGVRELFVSFIGYPEEYNDWVRAEDVQEI